SCGCVDLLLNLICISIIIQISRYGHSKLSAFLSGVDDILAIGTQECRNAGFSSFTVYLCDDIAQITGVLHFKACIVDIYTKSNRFSLLEFLSQGKPFDCCDRILFLNITHSNINANFNCLAGIGKNQFISIGRYRDSSSFAASSSVRFPIASLIAAASSAAPSPWFTAISISSTPLMVTLPSGTAASNFAIVNVLVVGSPKPTFNSLNPLVWAIVAPNWLPRESSPLMLMVSPAFAPTWKAWSPKVPSRTFRPLKEV